MILITNLIDDNNVFIIMFYLKLLIKKRQDTDNFTLIRRDQKLNLPHISCLILFNDFIKSVLISSLTCVCSEN